jgi:pilus assembly protein CpaC
MRHRKKLIFATILLLTAYVTWCFWPHSNPQAVRALAAMRELVDLQPTSSAPAANPPSDSTVEVSAIIAKLSITDATTALFAKSGGGPGFAGGRAEQSSILGLVTELHGLGVLEIVGRPQMRIISGQRGSMRSGAEVAALLPPPAAAVASPPSLGFQIVGTQLDVSPDIRADGVIRLIVDCRVTWMGGMRAAAKPKSIVTRNTAEHQTSVVGHLKPGETLIVGGLTKKWDAPTTFRLPLLSDLPGVGPWLRFEREREIEEEVIILATPRIVTPMAADGS